MNQAAALFNAHHSPVGAFATFTLGSPGPQGGLGLEATGPPDENIFIGAERRDGRGYEALPFFASSADAARRYDVSRNTKRNPGKVRPFSTTRVRREFSLGSDTWHAGDLTFSIYSAPKHVPDPASASRDVNSRKPHHILHHFRASLGVGMVFGTEAAHSHFLVYQGWEHAKWPAP